MKRNDLSRALVAFDQDSTIVAVVELSLNTLLVSGLLPGVLRQPLKKQPPILSGCCWRRLNAGATRPQGQPRHRRIVVAFESPIQG